MSNKYVADERLALPFFSFLCTMHPLSTYVFYLQQFKHKGFLSL